MSGTIEINIVWDSRKEMQNSISSITCKTLFYSFKREFQGKMQRFLNHFLMIEWKKNLKYFSRAPFEAKKKTEKIFPKNLVFIFSMEKS